MANNIVQLKRSSVSGRVPDAANVEIGEPVVNLADKILYTKTGSGEVIVIGAGTTSNVTEGTNLYFTNARAVSAFTEGTGINIDSNGTISATVTGGATISSSEPSGSSGALWLDPDTETIYIYSSSQWREFAKLTSGYFLSDYDEYDYDLQKLQYTLEQISNVNGTPQTGDVLTYNGSEWVPSTSLSSVLRLVPKTSAPSVSSGTFATADGVTWDPASKGSGKPYPVFYDGTSWNALY